MNLEEMRREYTSARLDEASVDPDPVVQFQHWLEEARTAGLLEPNAMALATASGEGEPSVRMVLLKGVSEDGLVFFTDYRSLKASDLEENPRAALLVHWGALERQVRVTGPVVRVPRLVSEQYFLGRPLGSQLGAWTSHQSAVVEGGRGNLEERLREFADRFAGGPVPCPPHWGGYRLQPVSFEFWQGRENRLHDRIRYDGSVAAGWTITRLSP